MSAPRVAERRAAYALQTAVEPALGASFDLLATAPQGVAKLRELILLLAVQGNLVTHDTSDETADALLLRLWKHHPEASARYARSRDTYTAPYQLPNTWTWVALGDLVENMGSGWSPACDEGKRTDGRRWAVLRTTSVQVMEYRPDEHKALPLKLTPRPDIEVKQGDILITRAGPMNRVGISCAVNETPPRLMLSDKIVRFHPISDELLPAFVVLALNAGWSREQLEQAKTGMAASQVNISQAQIKKVLVPICGMAEQARIVARVKELMQLCDALEAHGRLQDEQHARLVATLFDMLAASESAEVLAENWQRIATHFDLLLDRPEAIDALEQTLLQLAVRGLLVAQDPTDEPASQLLTRIREERDRLVGVDGVKRSKSGNTESGGQPFHLPPNWAWVPFNDIVRPDRPIAYGVLVPGPDSTDGVPFVRLADISLTDPPARPAKSISLDVDAQFVRTRLDGGEILIGVVGSIGKLGVAPMSWKGANIARAICRIVPTDLVDKGYILQLLQSEFMQSRFRGDTRTLAQPTLNVGLIRDCPTPLPPLAEQHRIVARVEQLRRLCAELRERLQQSRATQSRLADALVSAAAQLPSC